MPVRVCACVCVFCVPEGSPLLVRHRRSGILPESAAGGEDGAVGQVPSPISSVSQTSLAHGDEQGLEAAGQTHQRRDESPICFRLIVSLNDRRQGDAQPINQKTFIRSGKGQCGRANANMPNPRL